MQYRPASRFTCCGDTFGFAFASEDDPGIICLLSFALTFGSSGISGVSGGHPPLGSTGLPSASSTLISLSPVPVETTAGFGLSLSLSLGLLCASLHASGVFLLQSRLSPLPQ